MRISAREIDAAALREAGQRIEAALDALTIAENTAQKVALAIAASERMLAVKWDTLDPTDDDEVSAIAGERARIDVLKNWINSDPPMRVALTNLEAAIRAAKEPVQDSAQARSLEEGSIALCHWFDLLLGLSQINTVENRVQFLRGIAHTVAEDIRQLLSGRVGIWLTSEERRTGFLRDGICTLRPLTPEEQLAGVANE